MKPDKKILQDGVFILLFLNIIFVLLAYSYNSFNKSISQSSTQIKQALLFFSFLFLIIKRPGLQKIRQATLALPALMLLFTFTSPTVINSLYKISTFIIPYFYILFSINYLLRKFEFKSVFAHLILLINLCYLYPVLVYFLFSSGFEKTNIYGIQDQGLFYSNHYGWASTIFLTTLPAVLSTFRLNAIYRYLLLASILLALYLVMISANRASLLALGVSFLALFFFRKGISLSKGGGWKLIPIVILLPVYIFQELKSQKGSSIDFLNAKNEKQFETKEMSESRLALTEFAFAHFNQKPYLWLSGVGLFNYEFIRGATNLAAYHNSYWEVLFGCGLIVFLIFVFIMVYRPLVLYGKYLGNYALIIFPLILIPFFESNITGGQFLFFPWFSVMLLLNARKILPEAESTGTKEEEQKLPTKTSIRSPQLPISRAL